MIDIDFWIRIKDFISDIECLVDGCHDEQQYLLSVCDNEIKKSTNLQIEYDDIINCICQYYGVSLNDITSSSRKREYAQSRQMCIYFGRKYTKLTMTELAGKFNLNHATASYSCRLIRELAQNNRNISRDVIEIDMLLKFKS